jgi:predicted RNA-binding Zn-ribbon protein involved in translation (DUF1610 family)
MPRATCRCGQDLNVPDDGSERIVCPKCGAKVRVRLPVAAPGREADEGDGYVRFNCPCGRRLKVKADARTKPSHGKCPDCGRVVPVPTAGLSPNDPESPTEELSTADLSMLDEWTRRHIDADSRAPSSTQLLPSGTSPFRSEAGLRVCPRCGKPVHLGASSCRECGIPVPKR